jgi:cytochrome c2
MEGPHLADTVANVKCTAGTRMAFVGIRNDKDIADLWAYLKQFGADGAKK